MRDNHVGENTINMLSRLIRTITTEGGYMIQSFKQECNIIGEVINGRYSIITIHLLDTGSYDRGTSIGETANKCMSVISVLGRRLYLFDAASPELCTTYLGVSWQ